MSISDFESGRRDSNPWPSAWQADVIPLNYARRFGQDRECREPESNWRHRNFQSRALPTELSRRTAFTQIKRGLTLFKARDILLAPRGIVKQGFRSCCCKVVESPLCKVKMSPFAVSLEKCIHTVFQERSKMKKGFIQGISLAKPGCLPPLG